MGVTVTGMNVSVERNFELEARVRAKDKGEYNNNWRNGVQGIDSSVPQSPS